MPNKILIALSGGVDSTVTAALLRQAGHEIMGVTMVNSSCSQDVSKTRRAHGCLGFDKTQEINEACVIAKYLNNLSM